MNQHYPQLLDTHKANSLTDEPLAYTIVYRQTKYAGL
jgi:hypothetical protein